MRAKSRLQPQHRYWYEDLPDKHNPVRSDAALFGDLSFLNNDYLDISRQASVFRGVGALSFLLAIMYFVYVIQAIYGTMIPLALDDVPLLCLMLVVLGATMVFACSLGMMDVRMPRDRPIRFNRATGKVYVQEYNWTWNPFTRWYSEVKVFDWENLHAELTKQAGYSGKVYMERYALSLASCKPGTLEVVDRFDLKSGMPTTNELYRTWAYVRRYMEQGAEGLPRYKPRAAGNFVRRRSFFEHMPFLDPTQEGRDVRERMSHSDWLFNIPFVLLLFWLWIPLGIFHYIAMRIAPEPVWPADLDAESRRSGLNIGANCSASRCCWNCSPPSPTCSAGRSTAMSPRSSGSAATAGWRATGW